MPMPRRNRDVEFLSISCPLMLFEREPLVQDRVNRCFRERAQEAMAYFLPVCDPMRGGRIWAGIY